MYMAELLPGFRGVGELTGRLFAPLVARGVLGAESVSWRIEVAVGELARDSSSCSSRLPRLPVTDLWMT